MNSFQLGKLPKFKKSIIFEEKFEIQNRFNIVKG